jgi:DNA-dependent RNA polymerase auxiliary subunit epsilon
MKTYIITTRSTVYSTYEIEADTEQEAREIMDTQYGVEPMTEWSEDTEVYEVETEEEEN